MARPSAKSKKAANGSVEFFQQSAFPELEAKSSEIAFLDEWLEEVRAKRPLSKLEVMEREMERAIAGERYERAAELRDAIRQIKAPVALAGGTLTPGRGLNDFSWRRPIPA